MQYWYLQYYHDMDLYILYQFPYFTNDIRAWVWTCSSFIYYCAINMCNLNLSHSAQMTWELRTAWIDWAWTYLKDGYDIASLHLCEAGYKWVMTACWNIIAVLNCTCLSCPIKSQWHKSSMYMQRYDMNPIW